MNTFLSVHLSSLDPPHPTSVIQVIKANQIESFFLFSSYQSGGEGICVQKWEVLVLGCDNNWSLNLSKTPFILIEVKMIRFIQLSSHALESFTWNNKWKHTEMYVCGIFLFILLDIPKFIFVLYSYYIHFYYDDEGLGSPKFHFLCSLRSGWVNLVPEPKIVLPWILPPAWVCRDSRIHTGSGYAIVGL